jgi:hypothetical protein
MAYFSHPQSALCSHTNDEIRPSDERFRYVYETGFRTWARLYSLAKNNHKLPYRYLSPQEAVPQHPSFPSPALVECDGCQAFITASFLWGSKAPTCNHELPPFERLVQIGVTAKDPIQLTFSDVAQDNPSYGSWLVSGDNYLPVLVLAWTYILSARWAELMSSTCSIKYTQAPTPYKDGANETRISCKDQDTVYIDIDYADQKEARWWSAILSPGQGWRAMMHSPHATLLSPWSIEIQSSLQFQISLPVQQSLSLPNPTYSAACEYLTRFCIRHNIIDQSHAALASALLLPSLNDGRTLQLPVPRINRARILQDLRKEEAQHHREDQLHCPDRLLLLSCNTRGIRPMLLSVFYETQIECNTVTPWLQGTLSAIETLAREDPCIIGRMCMERTPEIAYLWVGATILGLQKQLLQDVRRGQIPFDPESAAWSRTTQSFIQQPVSNPLVMNGLITRADECRLLFLSRSHRYLRYPVCQWKPFGATSVEDVDIEVRVHCDCGDHKLQYQGLRWNNTDSEHSLDQTDIKPASHPDTSLCGNEKQVIVSYEALSRKNEIVSENATRSIFGWLRSDGWAHNEKNTSEHPWLDACHSESESEGEDGFASDGGVQDLSLVTLWIHGG